MSTTREAQRIFPDLAVLEESPHEVYPHEVYPKRVKRVKRGNDYLLTWLEAFLTDCRVSGLAAGSLRFYRQKLELFTRFCEGQAVTRIGQIDAGLIREYLFWLEATGHNPGGRHGAFRALRAFLHWWEREAEPEGWKNPMHKVKAPKVAVEPLDPVSPEIVQALLKTCKDDFTGRRDKALILFLLDSGTRAAECLAVNLEDVDLMAGAVLIRQGKGHKPRTVFIGKLTRRALRAYLTRRADKAPALWVTDTHEDTLRGHAGERLTYWGLRSMVQRRAKRAGVEAPELHGFRRAFALSMLRNGVDLITLQRLMGHTSLAVLGRYLAQTDQDMAAAHRRASPVDNNLISPKYGG